MSKITTHDITQIKYKFQNMLYEKMDILLPMLKEAYEKLLGSKTIYSLDLDYMGNLKKIKSFGDADFYAAVVDPKVFTHNKKALYIFAENAQWIIQFIDTSFVDEWKNTHSKGITIHRVFNPVDLKCIEESWGLKDTEKFVTKGDLISQRFTDVTKYSQKLSKGLIACERPTIDRVVEYFNKKSYGGGYYPVFCTSTRQHSSDFSMIEYCFWNMIMVCNGLKIKGAEL